MRQRVGIRVGAIAAAVLLAGSAGAHERSTSFSTWSLSEHGAQVRLRLDGRDLTRPVEAAEGAAEVDRAVVDALVASRGGRACRMVAGVSRRTAIAGRVELQWTLECPEPGPFSLVSMLPGLLATPHLTFARIEIPGSDAFEVVLDADRPAWQQPQRSGSAWAPAFASACRLGLTHIAGGLDHLSFVLGLMVAAVTLREVLMVVTAFTVAHGLTLAAAVFGWLTPATPAIDAWIAVSIALLAVENLVLVAGAGRGSSLAAPLVHVPAFLAAAAGQGRIAPAPLAGMALFAACSSSLAHGYRRFGRVRWLVTFGFGLLHGFGFAGALTEAGFEDRTLAVTLLGFHAGIESGQLLLVASVWPVLSAVRRHGATGYRRLVLEPSSVVLLAAAVAWYAAANFH